MFRFICFSLTFLLCSNYIISDNGKLRDPFNLATEQKSENFEVNGILSTQSEKIVSLTYKEQSFAAHVGDVIDKEWKVQEILENFVTLQNLKTNEQKIINLN